MEKLSNLIGRDMETLINKLKARNKRMLTRATDHIERWVSISNHMSIDVDLQSALSVKGNILGKEYAVSATPFNEDDRIYYMVRVTANNAVTGDPILIESYVLDSDGTIQSPSLAVIEPGESNPSIVEYHVICEALLAVLNSRDV